MLQECIEGLQIKSNGIYIDGTMGGAGHSIEIVKRLSSDGRLIGIDRDEEALKASKERLAEYKNVTYIHDNPCERTRRQRSVCRQDFCADREILSGGQARCRSRHDPDSRVLYGAFRRHGDTLLFVCRILPGKWSGSGYKQDDGSRVPGVFRSPDMRLRSCRMRLSVSRNFQNNGRKQRLAGAAECMGRYRNKLMR